VARLTPLWRTAIAVGLAAAAGVATAGARLPQQLAVGQVDRAATFQAVLAAEDTRAPTAADLETLRAAAGSADAEVAAAAVRALGRLERPDLLDDLKDHLDAASPAVRAEAANAVAQAVSAADGDPVRNAGRWLRDRLGREERPSVRGVVAGALGRLPYSRRDDAESAEAALVDASVGGGPNVTTGPANQQTAFGSPVAGITLGFGGNRPDAPLAALLGVADGFEALVRTSAKIYAPSNKAIDRLRRLAVTPIDRQAGDDADLTGFEEVDAAMADAAVRVRRLALQALVTSKSADDDTVVATLGDPDAQVRRLAILAAQTAATGDALGEYLARGMGDAEPVVRLEAVRAYGRTLRQVRGCGPLVKAIEDLDVHVRLEAIDQLGGCKDAEDALAEQASAISSSGDFWHAPAHALVSLARVAPDRAKALLPAFTASSIWQARMYAARAAATAGERAVLERLARDGQPNVRDAAISGLVTLVGHDADDLYLAALGSGDYQLVRTAARALAGTPSPERVRPRLVAALARLTSLKSDTSRDPRLAILETMASIGDASVAPALWPYLDDFDPRVASLAARTLTTWTGVAHAPVTTRMALSPPPDWRQVSALAGARARFFMADGGAFEIELHARDAPATVARFARLAREGYYDGLTFHRVVPNFVIQGGSPGANEYVGADPYMRDEVGLRPHDRGAVGISTRGRDTGDAQIFIDLVDNPRLDHAFTVFATVVRGLDDVDDIVEGAVIERVEIVQ